MPKLTPETIEYKFSYNELKDIVRQHIEVPAGYEVAQVWVKVERHTSQG